MFWGLILASNKKYTQTVETTFHVSMASLDDQKTTAGSVQVSVTYDNTTFLVCTLNKQLGVLQQKLDLNFEKGTTISFSCNGGGTVHLTGYLVQDEEDELFDEEDGSSIDDEDIPELVSIDKKRKAKGDKNDAAKKIKLDSLADESDSDDDEENGLESNLEEDDDDDDDDDEEEEDDDEDDDDDEDEVEEKVPVSKKSAKKEVVTNGKEAAKPAKDAKQKKNKDKKNNSKAEEKPEQQQQKKVLEQQLQKKRVIEGGVQVEDIKVGNGAPAKSGKFVGVYYVGRLMNGKKFDSTLDGSGFKFRLGKGEVIKGWDVGIVGMKIGGKRRITIPASMAYGARGSPPVIPPNSQLVFEVELKSVS